LSGVLEGKVLYPGGGWKKGDVSCYHPKKIVLRGGMIRGGETREDAKRKKSTTLYCGGSETLG